MFLRKIYNKDTGRTYLSIVHGYRDKDGKSRSKTIESVGYLDELEKEYDNPIEYFSNKAKIMTQQYNEEKADYIITISKTDKITKNAANRKSFGYAALSKIYHELGIHTFFTNRQRHTKDEYNANTIMKMLVFLKALKPSSKKQSYEERGILFEKNDYSLNDVYKCLAFLNENSHNLQKWVHNKIQRLYGTDSCLIYYNVTNYYFETKKMGDLSHNENSKERKLIDVIQTGLFIDSNKIPVSYSLFSGNTNDYLTYISKFTRIKKDFNVSKVIVVFDTGLPSGDNLWYILSSNNGYMFSQSVRGADKEIKDYILDEKGYTLINKEIKQKSRLSPRTINITSEDDKKIAKTVYEKQVVYYSEKYAIRAREKRKPAIEKAKDLILNSGKYNRSNSYGAASYVKNLEFIKKTGEISKETILELNVEKIKNEERFDGYYLIITSEHRRTINEIVDIYHRMAQVEEFFKIVKSDLLFCSSISIEEQINAHILTCFITLVILRILELKTHRKYSIARILESLRKASCSHINQNHYLFDYYDDILELIGLELDIDFSQKVLTLGEVKKIIGSTK